MYFKSLERKALELINSDGKDVCIFVDSIGSITNLKSLSQTKIVMTCGVIHFINFSYDEIIKALKE